MQDDRNRWLGTLLIAGSAIAYSLSGYFTRLIILDVWTVLFWRGIFGGLFIGAYVAWRHRDDLWGAIRAVGMAGIAVMLLSTLATICFINALRLIPVADVMTIHAAIPFMTAVLAFIFTREQEDWITWVASLIALIGVAIIVNPQAASGQWTGTAFALTMALADLMLFGTAQFGLGLLLMTLGTRLISATRSALIGSMENPLAPLWVWLAFGEHPAMATWIGGALVMGAVVFDVLTKSRRLRNAVEVAVS